jgi:hypothetical protein
MAKEIEPETMKSRSLQASWLLFYQPSFMLSFNFQTLGP